MRKTMSPDFTRTIFGNGLVSRPRRGLRSAGYAFSRVLARRERLKELEEQRAICALRPRREG